MGLRREAGPGDQALPSGHDRGVRAHLPGGQLGDRRRQPALARVRGSRVRVQGWVLPPRGHLRVRGVRMAPFRALMTEHGNAWKRYLLMASSSFEARPTTLTWYRPRRV